MLLFQSSVSHDFGNSNPWSSQIFVRCSLFPGWSWQDLHCIGSCTTHCWGQGTTELTGVETFLRWPEILWSCSTPEKDLCFKNPKFVKFLFQNLLDFFLMKWVEFMWPKLPKLPLKLAARTRRFQAQCNSSCAVLCLINLPESYRGIVVSSRSFSWTWLFFWPARAIGVTLRQICQISRSFPEVN